MLLCDTAEYLDTVKVTDCAAAKSPSTRCRSSSSNKLCPCDIDADRETTSQRAPASKVPCNEEPRRSCTRSSLRQSGEERTCLKGSDVELAEPAVAPDPLSRKSSEGLRWISKLADEETAGLKGSGKELLDEECKAIQKGSAKESGDNLTQKGSGRELGDKGSKIIQKGPDRELGDKQMQEESYKEFEDKGDKLIQKGSDRESRDKIIQKGSERELEIEHSGYRSAGTELLQEDDHHSTGSEEPIVVRGSSLPSVPFNAVISYQCLAVVCCSTFLLFVMLLVLVAVVYNRLVATSAVLRPTSHGDAGNSRTDSRDDSGCNSFFSFSQCGDSDMFG